MNKEQIEDFWNSFCEKENINKDLQHGAWYFCDNEKDANELADLVLKGIKTGTSSNNVYYEFGERKPEIGDYDIVLDWYGNPKCIIKTTKVVTLRFDDVTEDMAYKEGEGDKSLDYWQNVHKDFFEKEMKAIHKSFSSDMLIVYQEFQMVHKY